jgi:hypothetical protein
MNTPRPNPSQDDWDDHKPQTIGVEMPNPSQGADAELDALFSMECSGFRCPHEFDEPEKHYIVFESDKAALQARERRLIREAKIEVLRSFIDWAYHPSIQTATLEDYVNDRIAQLQAEGDKA